MIRALPLILMSTLATASDFMHVPLLVKHWKESHAFSGSIVGYTLDSYLRANAPHLAPIPRALVCVASAVLIGTFKEYEMDLHARPKEIWPWGVGAACAVSIRFSF